MSAASAGLISAGFAGVGNLATAATKTSNGKGLISVYHLGPLKLHNYMAPASSAVVTSQIIETENQLHIIDTQFMQSLAAELRSYANSLGKPIERVCLSHWHPDHILGASQFADREFVTTVDVANDCEKNLQTYVARKEMFKDSTPLNKPKGVLEKGTMQWDGVDVIVDQIDGCEAEHMATFHFPEAGLMIVQDLMFNNVHTFPLGNHERWIAALEKIRATEGLQIVGCGHGLPATTGAISDTMSYLAIQKEILNTETTSENAVLALTNRFPNYDGLSVLRFVEMLYK